MTDHTLLPPHAIEHGKLLWQPTLDQINNTQVIDFAHYVLVHAGFDWGGNFQALWQWSVTDMNAFWKLLWQWHGVVGDIGSRILINETEMLGAQFFPDAKLNFAENLLVDADDQPAVSAYGEDGRHFELSRAELAGKVMSLAGWLKTNNVTKGDRVVAFTPNVAEAVITMLATATLGAVYSSCSPDFGINGVVDRFGQIEPKVLMACDGHLYAGKKIDHMSLVADLVKRLPTLEAVLILPYLDSTPNLHEIPNACYFHEAIDTAEPVKKFSRVGFNDPLYILYSSGTTGPPKCIVHGVGGTLLQHIKEHRLHGNVANGDTMFYFTTCGWMMWNWLVSALVIKVKLVLFEGNPFFPGPERLWELAEREKISVFGTSAKYLDAVRQSGYVPKEMVCLNDLRILLSTGSPLSSDGFAFVYSKIKTDVQLSSISGGTDIVSCFALGCPVQPVFAGEIQTRGLGMKTDVLDESGNSISGKQGELCCTAPFPSMPIKFWNDPDGTKYQSAYFNHFSGIWRHGDWATLTKNGGIVIHGRSDATLNPGGVRIGTAEIYRQVEAFNAIVEAIVIGQKWHDDVRIVLFVKLSDGTKLDDQLKNDIRSAVREGATPRHVPAIIIAVPDIPRTRSGKITELAVKDIIHGRTVKNTEALANAEALSHFKNLTELQ
ncbi:acetoacetate--CoA ligase [Candidatus Puniceispirillum sp.]|nr:acetoacetate--CoA ligase [Candidatus Puniceispirillum sp.]